MFILCINVKCALIYIESWYTQKFVLSLKNITIKKRREKIKICSKVHRIIIINLSMFDRTNVSIILVTM